MTIHKRTGEKINVFKKIKPALLLWFQQKMKNFMNSNKLFVVLVWNKNSIFETLNIFADSFIDEIITKCLHGNLCGLLMLQKVFMLNFC